MKSFTHTHTGRGGKEGRREGGREGVGERGREGGREGGVGEMYLSMYLVEGLGTDNFDTVPFLIRYSF